MTDREQKEIRLGVTDGFRYIGFQPPLSADELNDLPMPVAKFGEREHVWEFSSLRIFGDRSMAMGFDSAAFQMGEPFENYVEKIATHLGGCSIDPAIRMLGPGSLFSPENS